jgi:hypothetical protein
VNKPQAARAITIVVLTGAAGLAWYVRSRPAASAEVSRPEDAVYAMYDAARAGDAKQYLGFFTGAMVQELERSEREMTADAFAKYLRGLNEGIKGLAVHAPETITESEVKLRVEYVFADRNEVQWMYLENANGSWRIARVDATERVKTLIPYGTPVK